MAEIKPLKDGPYEVDGPCVILDVNGHRDKEGDKFYLCRCGQSGNKPFCDGTHKKVGWSDS